MFELAIAFLLVLVVIPLVVLLIRWKLAYRVLSSVGIKGPSPSLFFGNGKEMNEMGRIKFVEANLQKYGNIFGCYVGIRPMIVVRDLDMLKEIMVKQFETFIDREHSPDYLRKPTSSKARGLLFSRGEDWRRMRRILSKSFNAINLNKMSSLIARSCDSLELIIEDNADTGKSFDVWRLYGQYTMEVILATGFGHYVNIINGEGDQLTEASASLFSYSRGSGNRTNSTILHSNFPFMEGYIRKMALKTKAAKHYLFIESETEDLLRRRLDNENTNDYPDLLQLMIDARADSDDENESKENKFTDPFKKKLTDVEIIRTAISFLLAGYETTSNALGYASYLLALHPAEQDKLYQEINDFYDKKPGASLYEAAQSLPYLDMIVQEVLRMYSPAPFTNRQTMSTTEINGQVFPKGSIVLVPIMAIHYSPDLWHEPSVFKPERFAKEEKAKRHPMAHMPFGWGPRACIGMRLSLMEAKMALIAILKEYKFVEAPDTEKPLKTSFGITMSPTNGIYLEVQRRQ